jgi:stalled ribosome alternative rescue factor ArfA
MVKKAKTQTRRVNPVARSLRLPVTAPRVVKPKKGKGSYSRKRRGRGPQADAGAGSE